MPQRVGATCRNSATIKLNKVGTFVSTGATKVTRVRRISDGVELTLSQSTTTVSKLVDGTTERKPATKTTLVYVLRDDGTLAIPTSPFAGPTMAGLKSVVSGGAQLFPSVPQARKGVVVKSKMTVTLDAESASDTSVRSSTTDGKAMRADVSYVATGVPTSQVSVGKKTFRDVVAVKTAFKITFVNAGPQMNTLMDALTGSSPSVTTWFARGLGPVTTQTGGGGLLTGMGKATKMNFLGCS